MVVEPVADWLRIFGGSLDDLVWCVHCQMRFRVRDIVVKKLAVGGGTIDKCPTPGCDGGPFDWLRVDGT